MSVEHLITYPTETNAGIGSASGNDTTTEHSLPVALIPAFKPAFSLSEIVEQLVSSKKFAAVVLVNDGSGLEYESVFQASAQFGAEVLRHFVNLGKGMALRTGFNHILCRYPDSVGVVTLDADGQHLVPDVLEVAERLVQVPAGLILGCRTFSRGTPLRSRIGNILTCKIMHLLAGFRISDTQTGLRGIPLFFIPHLLRLKTCGYDYELDMLVNTKKYGIPFYEVPISTVYIDNNSSSHFNPFIDSIKIYLVFIKFNISSLITSFVDYIIFFMCILNGFSPLLSMCTGRIASWIINYNINKKYVFKLKYSTYSSIFSYIIIELVLAVLSYFCMMMIYYQYGINIYASKIISESLLYIVNFVFQRDIVFKDACRTEICIGERSRGANRA